MLLFRSFKNPPDFRHVAIILQNALKGGSRYGINGLIFKAIQAVFSTHQRILQGKSNNKTKHVISAIEMQLVST